MEHHKVRKKTKLTNGQRLNEAQKQNKSFKWRNPVRILYDVDEVISLWENEGSDLEFSIKFGVYSDGIPMHSKTSIKLQRRTMVRFWLESKDCHGSLTEGFKRGLGKLQREVVERHDDRISKHNVAIALEFLRQYQDKVTQSEINDLLLKLEDETRESCLVALEDLCGCKDIL